MNQAETVFLLLLKAFIKGEKPHQLETDWQALAELAQRHSLSGVLFYMTRQLEQKPPSDIYHILKEQYFATIAKTTGQEHEIARIWAALLQAGFAFAPMKGSAIKGDYPVPELRTMGDLDFLVHQEEQASVRERMEALGYRFLTAGPAEWCYENSNLHVEIHHQLPYLRHGADEDAYMEEPWRCARRGADGVYHLDRSYHMAYLMLHMAKHLTGSGCGMRQMLDIALLLNRYSDWDWALLQEQLCKAGYWTFGKRVVSYCRYVFDVPVACGSMLEDSPELFAQLTADLMNNGTFGSSNPLLVRQYRQAAALKGQIGAREKRAVARTFFFPPLAQMKRGYCYLEKRPYLLPAAYVHRGVRGLLSKRGRLRQIGPGNEQQILAKAELYQKLGL